jgi:hypothetical protein
MEILRRLLKILLLKGNLKKLDRIQNFLETNHNGEVKGVAKFENSVNLKIGSAFQSAGSGCAKGASKPCFKSVENQFQLFHKIHFVSRSVRIRTKAACCFHERENSSTLTLQIRANRKKI